MRATTIFSFNFDTLYILTKYDFSISIAGKQNKKRWKRVRGELIAVKIINIIHLKMMEKKLNDMQID